MENVWSANVMVEDILHNNDVVREVLQDHKDILTDIHELNYDMSIMIEDQTMYHR